MNNLVAFIPVRGGSKSIPLKNIKSFCNQPLLYWTAKAANDCKYIERVYISTDSKEIKEVAVSLGFSKVCVVDRSPDTASDVATTESAMLDFANCYDFREIVLIQATSPLLVYKDLESGYEVYKTGKYDSLLSVVRQKRFVWKMTDDMAVPVNYLPAKRPRRQEMTGYFVENGAFYITSKEALLKSSCRLSGRIGIYGMSEKSYYEIDEPHDWEIMEQLKKRDDTIIKENN